MSGGVSESVSGHLFRTLDLPCVRCGVDLLKEENPGIVVLWRRESPSPGLSRSYEHVYWCCKGDCDQVLESTYQADGLLSGWDDIWALKNPLIYLKWSVGLSNHLRKGTTFSDAAYDGWRVLLAKILPFVARELTPKESDYIDDQRSVPSYLGGLGK